MGILVTAVNDNIQLAALRDADLDNQHHDRKEENENMALLHTTISLLCILPYYNTYILTYQKLANNPVKLSGVSDKYFDILNTHPAS